MPREFPADLMDGYQIAKREVGPNTYRYYLQAQRADGTWKDVKGPYAQSNTAKEWLARQRGYYSEPPGSSTRRYQRRKLRERDAALQAFIDNQE